MKFLRLGFLCLLSVAILSAAAQSQTLSVSVTPSAVTIHPGDQNVLLNVSLGSSSYSGSITVTLTGVPSGISVSQLTLKPGGSGTLILNASLSADQEGFFNSSLESVTTPVTVVAASSSIQATAQVALTVSVSNPSFAPSPQAINLPIVKIDTNGVPVVDKTTDVPGTITITSPDGQTSYLPSSSNPDNTATFHVHGNTTAGMPKLPYNIKLNSSLDLLTTMGAACPYVTSKGKAICDKSKTYILLANYDDKTLLRDWAASALANAIPIGNGYLDSPSDTPTPSGTSTLMPWAPHSLFVELYLNGVYEGNYQLIEKVNVDGNRVNIDELDETDTGGDLTGGYLMEIDQRQSEDDPYFDTPRGLAIALEDPDFLPAVPEQLSYITDYVRAAENALFSSNFTDPSSGWRAYFDEASLVNFYIVNDLMGNNDGGGFFSSDYFYKGRDNPLLYMGPVWDFDISSGNVNYNAITNPTAPWTQESLWYKQLFKDSGFKADVATQWNALKNNGVFSSWITSIRQQAQKLEQSQANNFARWPMLGIPVWPNAEVAGSYDGEVAYLTNWLKLRLAYLDSVLNSKLQTTTTLSAPAGPLRQGSSATLQAATTGGANPTGTVTFLANGVVLGTASLDGSRNASLSAYLPAGSISLTAVYNGDETNALSTSNAVPVSVSLPLASTATSLASAVLNVTSQNPATFTALVMANSGTATPTGSITFTADGQPLGTAAVDATGTATFSSTQLSVGDHSIQAVYGGDATYLASSSSPITVTVNATIPPSADFAISSSVPSLPLTDGQSASTVISVVPQNGFNAAVSFACSGLPASTTCSFSPATVTPIGGNATTTLTVSAPKTVSGLRPNVFPLFSGTTLAFGLGCFCWRKRPRIQIFSLLAAGILGLGLLNGCGGSHRSQSAPSIVTVTATAGALQHTTTFTLVVQETR